MVPLICVVGNTLLDFITNNQEKGQANTSDPETHQLHVAETPRQGWSWLSWRPLYRKTGIKPRVIYHPSMNTSPFSRFPAQLLEGFTPQPYGPLRAPLKAGRLGDEATPKARALSPRSNLLGDEL